MANTYDVTQKLQAIADAITQGGGGGGGTTVIANPSGTPTDTLSTIQIASTIYDIAGGGGGTGYTETTLWSGSPTTSPINLSDSVLNYDAIYVECMFNNEAIMCNTIDKQTFVDHLGTDYISFTSHANQYFGITPASTTTSFTFFSNAVNGCTIVIGIKYARGGGSDQAIDINYDNTQSGLTATNVQDAIDEITGSIDNTPESLTNGSKSVSNTAVQLFPLSALTKKYITVGIMIANAYVYTDINAYYIKNVMSTTSNIRIPYNINNTYKGYCQLIKDANNNIVGTISNESGTYTFNVTVDQHN